MSNVQIFMIMVLGAVGFLACYILVGIRQDTKRRLAWLNDLKPGDEVLFVNQWADSAEDGVKVTLDYKGEIEGWFVSYPANGKQYHAEAHHLYPLE